MMKNSGFNKIRIFFAFSPFCDLFSEIHEKSGKSLKTKRIVVLLNPEISTIFCTTNSD
jgi:hypothetical protein